MAQKQGSSSTAGGRLDGSIGTLLVAGDVAIGAGWGTTATKAILATSNDQRGRITVTASGASFAQATATVVVTFADGAYTAAPIPICTVTSNSAIDEGHIVATCTTTALTMTFSVLPVDTKIYVIHYALIA